jgi:hypothetical protein
VTLKDKAEERGKEEEARGRSKGLRKGGWNPENDVPIRHRGIIQL